MWQIKFLFSLIKIILFLIFKTTIATLQMAAIFCKYASIKWNIFLFLFIFQPFYC